MPTVRSGSQEAAQRGASEAKRNCCGEGGIRTRPDKNKNAEPLRHGDATRMPMTYRGAQETKAPRTARPHSGRTLDAYRSLWITGSRSTWSERSEAKLLRRGRDSNPRYGYPYT